MILIFKSLSLHSYLFNSNESEEFQKKYGYNIGRIPEEISTVKSLFNRKNIKNQIGVHVQVLHVRVSQSKR